MRLREIVGAATVGLCLALPAAAQAPVVRSDELPIDVHRIQRALRLAEADDQRPRLRFDAYVEVHGRTADCDLFEDQDLGYAAVRGGPPTHAEIMQALTPRQFQVRGADIGVWRRLLASHRSSRDRRGS